MTTALRNGKTNGKRNEVFQVRLTKAERRMLADIAKVYGETPSVAIRRLIRNGWERTVAT